MLTFTDRRVMGARAHLSLHPPLGVELARL